MRRTLFSLILGVLATLAGFRLPLLTAPVWVASFIIAKAGVRATNATLNFTYLAVDILFWSVIAYFALMLSPRHKKSSTNSGTGAS